MDRCKGVARQEFKGGGEQNFQGEIILKVGAHSREHVFDDRETSLFVKNFKYSNQKYML